MNTHLGARGLPEATWDYNTWPHESFQGLAAHSGQMFHLLCFFLQLKI